MKNKSYKFQEDIQIILVENDSHSIVKIQVKDSPLSIENTLSICFMIEHLLSSLTLNEVIHILSESPEGSLAYYIYLSLRSHREFGELSLVKEHNGVAS